MGLHINVYRNADPRWGDCTNGGISSRFTQLCVVNADGPFEPSDTCPPVLLMEHTRGCLRIVPAIRSAIEGDWRTDPRVHYMMGGNYGATSDSRFARLCESQLGISRFYGAVAIHDRVE